MELSKYPSYRYLYGNDENHRKVRQVAIKKFKVHFLFTHTTISKKEYFETYLKSRTHMDRIKTEVKWGVIFATTTLVWMLIERKMGWHDEHISQHMYMTNLFAIPAISVYVFALRDKRNQMGGKLSWKQGFFSGMIVTGVVFLLSPVTLWISVNIISPNFFSNMIK